MHVCNVKTVPTNVSWQNV